MKRGNRKSNRLVIWSKAIIFLAAIGSVGIIVPGPREEDMQLNAVRKQGEDLDRRIEFVVFRNEKIRRMAEEVLYGKMGLNQGLELSYELNCMAPETIVSYKRLYETDNDRTASDRNFLTHMLAALIPPPGRNLDRVSTKTTSKALLNQLEATPQVGCFERH